jgi:hypothetical protein
VVVENVVVQELEASGVRGEVLFAPLDHSAVEIHPDVAVGRLVLLNQLASNTSTSAPKIEDRPISVSRKVRVNELARGIVEGFVIGWADELSHHPRRER